MHLVTCTKNCGVAYMMLDKPELALPMIDRAVELQQVSLPARSAASPPPFEDQQLIASYMLS
jgi:hypothetical protein